MKLKSHHFFLLIIVAIPIVVRTIFATTYHGFDVGTFEKWIPSTTPFYAVYSTDCYCNYPIIGLFLSTGALKLAGSFFLFFLYLALFESINALLFYRLLGFLNIQNKWIYTLLFVLLPSTLSGGALWGQIDHIGLTFLLILLILLARIYQNNKLKQTTSRWYYLSIGGMFYLAIFTKQLLVFPLFPIGIAILLILYSRKNIKESMYLSLIMLAGFLVPFMAFETWLSYPETYRFTHYQRILETGSDHMDIISGNGITIWQLFFQNLEAPSTGEIVAFLSPKLIGLGLTFFLSAWLFFSYIKLSFRTESVAFQLGLLCLIIAVFNLTFNLFLTGTHERYLFYFYPFLILAFLGLRNLPDLFKKYDLALFFIGSIGYGLFVLAILKGWLKVDNMHVNTAYHKMITIIHLLIFIRLVFIIKKIRTYKV